ncbi:hypothetical protein [Longimicrobium terrae]|uniref:Uncharacterized protein n=1 Tax=Longimicrobium terrae TaxID=1639882 RepID=A0A841GZZ0_9BACT|nr:hypothetical protein [Longimicrobium terrae]MBB4636723.1 hypothetical protein [Longimicrobium terrae]MBB6071278.1 hypothetical protein [Longimicrobium terrae]NNC29324.1 hypothetical protein [Longimicrobium terrae]
MSAPFHVMIKPGDALAEVDRALDALKARGVSREDAGFHKYMFVTQAKQTVLMVTTRQAPLAAELRGRPGWSEPGDVTLNT